MKRRNESGLGALRRKLLDSISMAVGDMNEAEVPSDSRTNGDSTRSPVIWSGSPR